MRTHILSIAGKIVHYDTESDYDGMMPAYYESVIPKSHLLRGTVPHKVLIAGMFKGVTLVVASYFWQRFAPATLTTQADVLNWFIQNDTYISTHHIHNQLVANTPLEDIMPNYETQSVWNVVKDWAFVDRPDLDFYFVTGDDSAGINTFRDELIHDDPIATQYADEKMIVNLAHLENDPDMVGVMTEYWRYFSDSDADNLVTWGQKCVRWDCIYNRLLELKKEQAQ